MTTEQTFTCSPIAARRLDQPEMPQRIQRKRTKGWRMPPNTISVTRPGKWGNPFAVGHLIKIGDPKKGGFSRLRCLDEKYNDGTFIEVKNADHAVELYRRYITLYPPKDIAELKGKNLACFCPIGQPCHADVLLKLANS